jgi:YbbR domain-containing protein
MMNQFDQFIEYLKTKDFLPKIVCLLLALFLWGYIGTLNNGDLRVRVKTEVRNLPRSFVVTDIQKKYLTVRVHGNLVDLETIDRKKIEAYVDISAPVSGQPVRYRVFATYPDLPESVKLIPSDRKVFVTVNRKIAKSVYVTVPTTGKVKEGSILGNITLTPERVSVLGGRSELENLKRVSTEVLDLTDASKSFSQNLLVKLKGDFEFTPSSPKELTASVEVFPAKKVVKYEQDLDFDGLMENYSYDFSHRRVTIYVRYTDDLPPALSSRDIKVWADLTSITESAFMDARGDKTDHVVTRVDINSLVNKNTAGVSVLTVVPNRITVTVRN